MTFVPGLALVLLTISFTAFGETTLGDHLARQRVKAALPDFYPSEPRRLPQEFSYFEEALADTDQGLRRPMRETFRLSVPVLNPDLDRATLERALVDVGLTRVEDTFRTRDGARVTLVSERSNARLSGALFVTRPNAEFVALQFTSLEDLRAFARIVMASPRRETIFWRNPHYAEESRSRAEWVPADRRRYRTVELRDPCTLDFASLEGGVLYVPDLHQAEQADLLLATLRAHTFAWVALEEDRDVRDPAEMKTTKGSAIMKVISERRLPYVFMDYLTPYFHFPVTDTSGDPLIMATRNRLWVEALPSKWKGVGLVFGGYGHLTDGFQQNFQDAFAARFPDRPLVAATSRPDCR